MISPEDIELAAQSIAAYVRRTPVIALEPDIWHCSGHLMLKLEQLQHSGSFKVRGAFHSLLSQAVPPVGVIAASGGNHGVAVAYAARQLGYHAEIFVPEISSPIKIELLRRYGADVHIGGASYADALALSNERAIQTGALVVHAYNQPEVIAGQGTLGYELAQQIPELDTIFVAVGGGGLIGGIASWFQGAVKIIGVESYGTASMHSALQAGHPVDVEISGLAADALGARRAGDIPFAIAQQYVDHVELVSDEAIRRGQQALWDDVRIVAEPSAAACVAALLEGLYRPLADERVGIVICGGNAHISLSSD
jgi:threonine dehydratase